MLASRYRSPPGRPRRWLLVLVTVALVFATAASADAAHNATPSQRRSIAGGLRLGPQGGRIAWAAVSTAGPYAVVSTIHRPENRSFQDAVVMAHRADGRWRVVAVLIDQPCDSVPGAVLRDLHRFLAGHHPGVLGGPIRGPSCETRLQRAG